MSNTQVDNKNRVSRVADVIDPLIKAFGGMPSDLWGLISDDIYQIEIVIRAFHSDINVSKGDCEMLWVEATINTRECKTISHLSSLRWNSAWPRTLRINDSKCYSIADWRANLKRYTAAWRLVREDRGTLGGMVRLFWTLSKAGVPGDMTYEESKELLDGLRAGLKSQMFKVHEAVEPLPWHRN